MQVAGKGHAGPSIRVTSTDFVSQNYLCIQNSILHSLYNLRRNNYIFNTEIVKIIPFSTYD